MSDPQTELVVLGGGPGGYAAAFYAADLGIDVTLVDLEKNPGGVCLYRGCIPSKALLHVAKLLKEVKHAKNWGIDFGKPKIDMKQLGAFTQGVVTKLTGGLGQLAKARKVNFIQGRGSFESSSKLRITDNKGKDSFLTFQKAIIAAGSRPITLPNFLESQHVWDSTSALELREVPKKLLVVGGGYIGLELGSVYAALGSEVTVVELLPALMNGADRDLVNVFEKTLRKDFKNIHLETKVSQVKEIKSGLEVTFEGKSSGKEIFEKVLVSVGRKPNSSGLGLSNTKVKTDDKGFIEIAPNCATNDPNIFAIGDIVGGAMLAHKASHEARVAVDAVQGKRVAFQPLAIPAVVFTDPEIAWTGLTETEAKSQNKDIVVEKFPWAASGRATTLDRNDGLTKIIMDPKTERVLGVGIVGPGAGELIAEGTLAVEMGATISDLSLTIHPHPTLSETIMETAEMFHGLCTHMFKPKRKQKMA